MPLPLMVENLEAVDKALHGLYVEQDGKFRLDVDGIEDTGALKKALQSERENVKKAKADLRRFEGVDPEKYAEAMKRLDEIEAKGGGGGDDAKARIEKAIKAATEPLNKQLESISSELKVTRDQLHLEVLDKAIRDAVAKVGEPHQGAWTDIFRRARETFKIDENGKFQAVDADGNPIYGKSGALTYEEWADSFRKGNPFFFQGQKAAGSGATGNQGAGAGGEIVLSKAEARDSRVYRKAKELAEKQGKTLRIAA